MAVKSKIVRREFLQLANTYDPDAHDIAGMFVSEKLDGTRCFWDGGLSRGVKTVDVPWASVLDPKTGNRKAKIKPNATGLWSRYGNPIMAPDSFLNQLPACPLDGELWAGRGNYQLCRSICGGDTPDPRFDQIQFAVYSTPPLSQLFSHGQIKNANMHCMMDPTTLHRFFNATAKKFGEDYQCLQAGTFEQELQFLAEFLETQNDNVYLHRQVKLPGDELSAKRALDSFMAGVLDAGGEGVVIRDPAARWTPKRHSGLLKFKPFDDAEATIVGYVSGREGKQGNVLGKIGTLVCETTGPKGKVRFEIGTGLTMEERELATDYGRQFATENPETTLPPDVEGKHFKRGQTITFKYREFTDDGIPKEGRYWRVRNED